MKVDRFEPDNELFADGPVHIEHLGRGRWFVGTQQCIYEIKGKKFFKVDGAAVTSLEHTRKPRPRNQIGRKGRWRHD